MDKYLLLVLCSGRNWTIYGDKVMSMANRGVTRNFYYFFANGTAVIKMNFI